MQHLAGSLPVYSVINRNEENTTMILADVKVDIKINKKKKQRYRLTVCIQKYFLSNFGQISLPINFLRISTHRLVNIYCLLPQPN